MMLGVKASFYSRAHQQKPVLGRQQRCLPFRLTNFADHVVECVAKNIAALIARNTIGAWKRASFAVLST